jgi:hypothetical protein
VIETILFKNGQAVTKTNIDHEKALRHVRTPLDSATVYTEVFTEEGSLIAAGKERIHNPEGLQWFQNIELTALNTFAITARDGAPRPEEGVFVRQSRFFPFEQSMQQIPGSHHLGAVQEGRRVDLLQGLPEHAVARWHGRQCRAAILQRIQALRPGASREDGPLRSPGAPGQLRLHARGVHR